MWNTEIILVWLKGVMKIILDRLDSMLQNLDSSVQKNDNSSKSLSIWAAFVKYRDGYKCLRCGNKKQLESHHIFRKCFMPEAMFDPGNGITLCKLCHREMHRVFNRRPSSSNFMNAEGGDDADIITENLYILLKEAKINEIDLDKYYGFSEEVLIKSEHFQGVELARIPDGSRIEQMFYIWRQCPPKLFRSVAERNGVSIEPPFDEGIAIKLKDDGVYVTVVDIGDFAIENRGSLTMVFEPQRDIGSLTRGMQKFFKGRKVSVTDARTRVAEPTAST